MVEKIVEMKEEDDGVRKYVRFCNRGGGIPVHGGVFPYFVEQNFSHKQKSKNQNEHENEKRSNKATY